MSLKELLESKSPPEKITLSQKALHTLFWKYKGLQKQWDRANAFWEATNENLATAYVKLDEKDQELEEAYGIIQEDLLVASKIQQALLPEQTNLMQEELEIAVYHSQLSQVGGDYYDFFATRNDRYAIGVFDISGHGVSAALVMTYLKAQFMQAMESLTSPKEIVESINKSSIRFLRGVKKYATVNFLVFAEDHFRYVSGGGFGLLLHNDETEIMHKGQNFLGLRERSFTEYSLPFTSGDLLVIYSDGIVEAQNASDEDYTIKRLHDLVIANQDKSVDAILDLCMKDYENFRVADADDITLLIIRKK